jgi:hypothetical protein
MRDEDRSRLERACIWLGLRNAFQSPEHLHNDEIHQVGGCQTILEYRIPAEDLPALNTGMVGEIELVAEYH